MVFPKILDSYIFFSVVNGSDKISSSMLRIMVPLTFNSDTGGHLGSD